MVKRIQATAPETSRHLFTVLGLGGGFSFLGFKPKIKFEFSSGDYHVKVASNIFDVIKALQLRHKVFLEYKVKDPRWKIDLDKYDYMADHLIVMNKKNRKIVGTYRFICSSFYHDFYSGSEFDISNILFIEDIKLEVGRACIHPDFRNRTVLQLLWKGIAQYLKYSGAKYLFGCSSIPSHPLNSAVSIQNYLMDNYLVEAGFRVTPKIKPEAGFYQSARKEKENPEGVNPKIKSLLPPLLRGYLEMGCKICGEPAYDKDFGTYDYFTLLDVSALNPKFFKKFL